MKKIIFLFFPLASLASGNTFSPETVFTRQQYISLYQDLAIRDMERFGIPASITMAQAILESESGNSKLAREANNHFGIKCHKEWTGETYIMDDDKKDECFRKYKSAQESYDDHSNFLRTRERYAFLFDYGSTDYKGWAHGLKKAGYATNPQYAEKLIKIIEENGLDKLDKKILIESITQAPALKPNKPPVKESTSSEVMLSANVKTINSVPYILAKRSDTFLKIAKQHEMMLWQITKYNDADKVTSLKEGDIVYLKPKRRKAMEDFHIVKEGETMRMISQYYGVKMKFLYRYNGMEPDALPRAGDKIFLRKSPQHANAIASAFAKAFK